MFKLSFVLSSLFLTGCTTFGGMLADNYVKILEYDSDSGGLIPGFTAMAGGCYIATKGTIPTDANVTYNGAKCKVVIGDLIQQVNQQVETPPQLQMLQNEQE